MFYHQEFGSPIHDKLTTGVIYRLIDEAYAFIHLLILNGKKGGILNLTIEKLSNYDKSIFAEGFIKKYQVKNDDGNDLFVVNFDNSNITIQWNGGYIKAPSGIRCIDIETTVVP